MVLKKQQNILRITCRKLKEMFEMEKVLNQKGWNFVYVEKQLQ